MGSVLSMNPIEPISGFDALVVEVITESPEWNASLPRAEYTCWQAAVAAFEEVQPNTRGAEVNVILTDDARIKFLNKSYRNRDEPTDVLSFPILGEDSAAVSLMPNQPLLLGDIVIALETTTADAVKFEKPLSEHLSHLVVHGMLHLCGYNHLVDADAHEMERLETKILVLLGLSDPYVADKDL